jgi:hypothetical protein
MLILLFGDPVLSSGLNKVHKDMIILLDSKIMRGEE